MTKQPKKTGTGSEEPILLNEKEAAQLLGFKPKTLQGWRTRGHVQLPFVRISKGCVRYRRSDIDAWLEQQLRTSTSDDAVRGLVLRERKGTKDPPPRLKRPQKRREPR